MNDFVGADRAVLLLKLNAKIGAIGRAFLAREADGGRADECDFDAVLELARARKFLSAAPARRDAEIVVGHLLVTYHLASVPARPYTPGPLVSLGQVPSVLTPGSIVGLEQYVTNLILNTAGTSKVTRAITVSLAGGKTWGTLRNGDLIAANTPYQDLFERALIEDILPTYAPASLALAHTAPTRGEVGESVNDALTATFSRGDAGAATSLQINRLDTNARLGAAASTSPLNRAGTFVRPLGQLVFRALVSYGAGVTKSVLPAGTPDARPAQVRNANAPQAAETGLASNDVVLVGEERLFFGPTAAAPATSADARALPQTQLTGDGSTGTLVTGTTERFFALVLAPGQTLASVIDVGNANTNITAAYVRQSDLNVADAGGTVTARAFYLRTAAGPYTNATTHRFTTNG